MLLDRARQALAAVLALTVAAVAQGPRDASLAPSGDLAMAAAKKVFGTYCASCHGATGLGDGAAAAALQPKPRSFADSRWQRSVSDDHLAKVILDGGPAVGLSPTMAPARSMFDSEPVGTVDAMVAMVREFGRPKTLGVPAIDAAAKIYAGYCSTCHGAAGLGDGAASAALDPKPRSFTDHAWQSTISDDHLAKVILEGGPAVALSPLMAPAKAMFANEPDGTIDAVIALVRGFSRKEPVPADAIEAAGKLFATYCSTCHGVAGLGDGAASSGLVPRPRSFADRHWQSSVSDAHLAKVILDGGPAVALSPLMVPAKAMFDGLPGRTIDAMVAQVRRLGSPNPIPGPP
ncbi:MAG: c-type cytochrome [Planctomycetes bacterium]|nr:c-type cytochrome [Planctomycetota bacterium]